MVKTMEIPIKMDDLGGKPTIFRNIHILTSLFGGGASLNFSSRLWTLLTVSCLNLLSFTVAGR